MRRLRLLLAFGSLFPLISIFSACAPGRRGSVDHATPCPSLDRAACDRARSLSIAATTYDDEAHDYVLARAGTSPASALTRTGEGWRSLPFACARREAAEPRLDVAAVDYAFVGVAVDDTLVSADADIGPLLSREGPAPHDVALIAIAFVHDRAPASFDRGEDLLERPNGECVCGGATDFAGATKFGASVSYTFRAPGRPLHARAIDVVRSALGDPHVSLRASTRGEMTIDGLARFLSGGPGVPLAFRVKQAVPVAYAATPIDELCDFAAPELSPSPLDFGAAPYGTEARRSVHAVNRSAVDLQAILGASSFTLPARGAIDLPLRWTPDGDAPGCETQTRDEAIPFARVGGRVTRSARVLETIRTGRATVERAEHVEPSPGDRDRSAPAPSARDWTCPRDFTRTSCRVENPAAAGVVAEPRGKDSCHFECRGASGAARPGACSFDARMTCALDCPP